MNDTARPPFLNDKAYNALKFVALILLPALGSLYFALAGIWHLPNPDEIVGTITVVDAFLGVLIGYSSKAYNAGNVHTSAYDGAINIEPSIEDGMPKVYSLDLNYDPKLLDTKNTVTFKVNG